MEKAEEYKKQGNSFFAKGQYQNAIEVYSSAIDILPTPSAIQEIKDDNKHSLPPFYLLRLTLLSNRALCYVKISETLYNSSEKTTIIPSWRDAAVKGEEDCTTAINELDKGTISQSSNSNEMRSLRAKILFRRAKAYYIQTNVNMEDNANVDHNQLLNDAAKDLLQLLSFDTNNGAATSLLRRVRERHASSKATPLTKAVQDLIQNLSNINEKENITVQKSWDQQFDNLKLIYGILCQDIASSSMELGRKGGVQALTQVSTISITNIIDKIDGDLNKEEHVSSLSKSKALAIQILSLSVSHLPFAISFFKPHQFRQSILNTIILECQRQQHQPKQIDIAIAVISLMLRIVIAFHNESPEIMDRNSNSDSSNEISFMDHYVDGSAISQICLASMHFATKNDNRLQRAAIDLLSTWTSSNWEDIALSASTFTNSTFTSTASHKKKEQMSESDIQSLPPRQFAAYRKREYEISLHKKQCAKRNVLLFCDEQTGGLHTLLNAAIDCGDDNKIRKEIVLLLGRMLYTIVEDYGSGKEKDGEKTLKKLVGPLLGFDGSISEEEEKVDGLKIEEIYDDDEDTNVEEGKDININMDDKLKQDMIRALLTSSLLLCDAEVGSWALLKAWANGYSSESVSNLIKSENFLAMSIVSELLSAAASVEKARPFLGPIVQGGEVQILLESESSLIRSGAASALAKLGLSSKTVENADGEGEVMGLLQVAVDLIYDEEFDTDTKDRSSPKNSDGQNQTTTERGIELLSYLASKTLVKEEIAHGFRSPKSPPNKTALNRLVEIARSENIAADSTTCYGIATIFAQLAVSLETLRKEAFIGKDVTAEQYEELQALGKTEEEKEAAKEAKELELDPPESVNARIRKMANADVPLAMMKLMNACGYGGENTSHESTLEQLVIGMERMAIETSVRGIMIQQGCLSACIKLEQGPSSEKRKKMLRHARHCISKVLVTTNPNLLTSAQQLGSIGAMIQLVNDNESLDLAKFEALLSLTNLASIGMETKNRIVADKGISVLNYAMFSDHEMVRRAATEAMSNLIPHEAMFEHLSNPEKMRLWVSFATDYEDHFECARAATGCLAMSCSHIEVAKNLVKCKSFNNMIQSLLKCGNLEIMHRVLVIILNLLGLDEKICVEEVERTGAIAFCYAYVQSYDSSISNKRDELSLNEKDEQMIEVTIDLAKQIASYM